MLRYGAILGDMIGAAALAPGLDLNAGIIHHRDRLLRALLNEQP